MYLHIIISLSRSHGAAGCARAPKHFMCVRIGQYYYYDDYYFKRERPCMHISHMRKIIFDVQALGGSGGGGDGVPVHVITRNYNIIIVLLSSRPDAFLVLRQQTCLMIS